MFSYKGKDGKGARLSGLVEAVSEKLAVSLLRGQGVYVISIEPKGPSLFSKVSLRMSRVSFNDIVIFTQQLSTMISAGLSLTDALNILKLQVANPAFSKVVADILKDIEGGTSFSTALKKYPNSFSDIYISLVRAGEASGQLDAVLDKLSTNMEKQREFRSKTKGALVYPTIILIGMFLVVFIMMTFVVPRLTDLYKDFGTELPLTTKILIGISDFFVRFWWLAILIVWGSISGLRFWKATPIGMRLWDLFMLKLPIWGGLKKKLIMTEFTRTFGVLSAAGIPILESLDIVKDALESINYRDDLEKIARQVEKGSPLGMPISQNPRFPPIVGQMISVGEETGKLDKTLNKLAEFFEAEAEQGIKTLTTAMEPLIMVVLGVVVGFIVISVLMPIYNLTNQF